jgi:hypothetical protein
MDPVSTSRPASPTAARSVPGEGEATRRPPGRPALMTPEAVLARIRALSQRDDGLFRIHRRFPALYARARRMFGSWGAAVSAAGLDAVGLARAARLRAARTRRQNRRSGGASRS